MLKKFNVTNYEGVSFIQSEDQPTLLIITQADEYDYTYKYEIGRYDFSTKEGYLQLLNGTRKEYRRFNALLNNFFKYNEYFGWNSTVVNKCKEAAKQLTMVNEEVAVTTEVIEPTEETTEVIENNQMNEQTIIESYQVGNRTFTTYEAACNYCLESDFEPELMIIKESALTGSLNAINTTEVIQQPEVFNVYNNTFTTYSEAYNYCIVNQYPLTMILSSLHKTINNERLQELETQYKFSKHNMSITDMKEYFDYIMIQPISTDQEDRYYKLKGWIERYENKQRNIELKKQQEKEMFIQIDRMLSDLYSIGMIKKEYEHTTTTWYYLDNELIYNWSSGIPTEKMFNELTEVHKSYYKQSKAV